MNERAKQALTYLKDHWHIGMGGTADAAEFLGINRNTFKTRLSRGQAMSLRDAEGEQRAVLTFTGYHLVYNLLSDRLLRYGFPVEHNEKTMAREPAVYADWVRDKILSTPHHIDAILKFSKNAEGEVLAMAYEDGDVTMPYSDAALIVPIGHMVLRLAGLVHYRAMPALYQADEAELPR